jgi:branched-chain amino acid transport system substrate-binding protein
MVAFLASYAAKSTEGTDISSQMSKVSSAPGQKYTFEQLPEAIKALDAGQDIDYEGAWSSLELDQKGDPTANGWETWSFDGTDVKSLEQFEIR